MIAKVFNPSSSSSPTTTTTTSSSSLQSSSSSSLTSSISGMFDLYCFQDLPDDTSVSSSMTSLLTSSMMTTPSSSSRTSSSSTTTTKSYKTSTSLSSRHDHHHLHHRRGHHHNKDNHTSLPLAVNDELNKSLANTNPIAIPYKSNLSSSPSSGWFQEVRTCASSLTSSLAFSSPSQSSPPSSSKVAATNKGCFKNSSLYTDEWCKQNIPLNRRPAKIGIALIFNLPTDNNDVTEFVTDFFFANISVLECYIHRLKSTIEDKHLISALKCSGRGAFYSIFNQAVEPTLKNIRNFVHFPRLHRPLWLSSLSSLPISSSSSSTPSSSSSSFASDFVYLCDKCFTRNTKFFLGGLLTAVLTHHLSWVTTVDETIKVNPDKNSMKSQLRNLFGAIGFPCCLSRTVVIGGKVVLTQKILNVLSYFIRCEDIVTHDRELC
ncbi:hypothetical protein HELRODRAFT_192293, partial [Helobdella robusta]|uniref:Folliculin-interacting protein middle domain-containing protein n=1 Tax=Helobdella robusta TaxID=6412 RepID=T1FTS9_HELRO